MTTNIELVNIHYEKGMWRYDKRNIQKRKLKDGESISVSELESLDFPAISGLNTISDKDGSLELLGDGFMRINKKRSSSIDGHDTCQHFEVSERDRVLIRQTGSCIEVTPAYLITFEPRKK